MTGRGFPLLILMFLGSLAEVTNSWSSPPRINRRKIEAKKRKPNQTLQQPSPANGASSVGLETSEKTGESLDDTLDQVRRDPHATLDVLRQALLLASKCGRNRDVTWLFQRIDRLEAVTMADIELLFACYCSATDGIVETGAAMFAEKLLRNFESQPVGRLKPTLAIYRTVMTALIHTKGLPEAKHRAESIVDRMEDLYTKGDTSMRPSLNDVADIIDGWLQSETQSKTSVSFMDALLRMIVISGAARGDSNHERDLMTRTLFRDVLVSFGTSADMGLVERASAAENLFLFFLDQYEIGACTLEDPTSDHFLIVLQYWASCGEPELACSRSVHLLNRVKKLVDNEVLQAKDMHSVEVTRSLLRTLDKKSYVRFGEFSVLEPDFVQLSPLALTESSARPMDPCTV
jgi:hypothetical protein